MDTQTPLSKMPNRETKEDHKLNLESFVRSEGDETETVTYGSGDLPLCNSSGPHSEIRVELSWRRWS